MVDLSELDSHAWNRDLISRILIREEADTIYKIPISILGATNKLICWPTHNWVFLVKSTYYLETQRTKSNHGEPSHQYQKESIWKAIWRLNVQGVVKYFIWRAYHDSLPMRANLVKGKITTLEACPICEQEAKTLTHVLWECLAVINVWGEHESPFRKWVANTYSIKDLWEEILKSQNIKSQELCAIILRNLWMRRNTFVFDNNFTCPKQVLNSALQ